MTWPCSASSGDLLGPAIWDPWAFSLETSWSSSADRPGAGDMALSISEAQAELIKYVSLFPLLLLSPRLVEFPLCNAMQDTDWARSSLAPDDIPHKLRCANCSKLAVNALRLPCCEQAICETCTFAWSNSVVDQGSFGSALIVDRPLEPPPVVPRLRAFSVVRCGL